jgi:hypothetical protein
VSHAKRLESASGIFFFLGFAAAQLQRVPFIVLAAIPNIASIGLYFLGYMLWLVACQLLPDHPGRKKHWYGFTQFKNQHRAAAIIGTIAVFCSIVAYALPLAMIPACWLFAVSNCIWLLGEYHKKKNLFNHEKNYADSQQDTYLRYTTLTTALSIVTAITTTISLFCPVAAPVTIAISLIVGTLLATFALHYWLEYKFFNYQPEKQSYTVLSNKLGPAEVANELTACPSLSATTRTPATTADIVQDNEGQSLNQNRESLLPNSNPLTSSSIPAPPPTVDNTSLPICPTDQTRFSVQLGSVDNWFCGCKLS